MKNVNSWVEVSHSALIHNLKLYKNYVKPAKIMPIVKSNAYGHGMLEVAKIIEDDANFIGVVNLQEALELRQCGIRKPIVILSFFLGSDEEITRAIQQNISFPLYTSEDAQKLATLGNRVKIKPKVHIKLDTGTSRVGLLPKEIDDFFAEIQTYDFEVEGIFSHFAASEENQEYTNLQLRRFHKAITTLESLGVHPRYRHIACSAATLTTPQSHENLIRFGISLYGLWASHESRVAIQKNHPDFDLIPALTWKTRPIHIKIISKGQYVGYGCTYKTARETKLMILPVGYRDGYHRAFSNKAFVLLKGVRCGVIGRVCMNMMMVDITDVDDVDYTTEVVLLGRQGSAEVSAEELAEITRTIHYEIVTQIHPLLPRVITT